MPNLSFIYRLPNPRDSAYYRCVEDSETVHFQKSSLFSIYQKMQILSDIRLLYLSGSILTDLSRPMRSALKDSMAFSGLM